MKHIVLVAREGTPTIDGDAVEVPVGGNPDFTRAMWLENVSETASLVAAECHSNDVPPVLRVGGGASGAASLKTNSGVTGAIKAFPWDVFGPTLKRAYDLTQEEVHEVTLVAYTAEETHLPETHLYGEAPDEQVEQAALHGDDEALTKVIGVAAGEDHSHAARAKSVLAQVPAEELEHWNEAHQQ